MDVSLSVSDHIVSNRFTARVHCRCVTLSSPIDSGLPAARAVQVVAGRCVRSAAGPMMDVRRRVCPVRVQWASYRRSSTRQMSCSAADIVTSSCDHWSQTTWYSETRENQSPTETAKLLVCAFACRPSFKNRVLKILLDRRKYFCTF